MSSQKGSEFHVVLDGIKLPEATEKRIAQAINAIVANELASYVPDPDGSTPGAPAYFVLPHKWLGGLLISVDARALANLEKASPGITKRGDQLASIFSGLNAD